MGIQVARDALIKAAIFAATNREQTDILDLIEILRDYTESGRVRKEGTAIVTTQISQLNVVSKTLTKAINAQQKCTPKDPPSARPQEQRNSATSAPTRTYASATAQNLPKTQQWTTVAHKKNATPAPTPKNSLSQRRLILVQQNPSSINSLELRDKINDAFARNGVKSPVVASATLSLRKNIVFTTTPMFNAKYLLENKNVWQNTTSFEEALPISP